MHVCVRKRITSYAMSGIEGGKQGSPWQAPLSPSLLALHITQTLLQSDGHCNPPCGRSSDRGRGRDPCQLLTSYANHTMAGIALQEEQGQKSL